MSVAGRPLVELEEFPQVGEREMPLDILLPIDDARTEGLFVGLPLENLLLNGSDLDKKEKCTNVLCISHLEHVVKQD